MCRRRSCSLAIYHVPYLPSRRDGPPAARRGTQLTVRVRRRKIVSAHGPAVRCSAVRSPIRLQATLPTIAFRCGNRAATTGIPP